MSLYVSLTKFKPTISILNVDAFALKLVPNCCRLGVTVREIQTLKPSMGQKKPFFVWATYSSAMYLPVQRLQLVSKCMSRLLCRRTGFHALF
jgi:hypothetical protein